MAAVDDLVAAVSAVQASVVALEARVDAIIAGLPPAGDDPKVVQAVADLAAVKAQADSYRA